MTGDMPFHLNSHSYFLLFSIVALINFRLSGLAMLSAKIIVNIYSIAFSPYQKGESDLVAEPILPIFPPIKGRHNRKHKKKLHLPLVKIAN